MKDLRKANVALIVACRLTPDSVIDTTAASFPG